MPGPSARTRAGVAAASTFNSISLSWRAPGGGADVKVSVRFRPQGTGGWRTGIPLAYDARSDRPYGGEYRGSLVGLKPGVTYVIRLSLEGSNRHVTIKRRTWSERIPVARTIRVSPSRATPDLRITKGGGREGFVLYIPSANAAAGLKVPTSRPSAVSVEASYVIVRGFKIRGGRDGVHVGAGQHDVVIERNDISGWGRIASDAGERPDGTTYATSSARLWGEDRDAAIACDGGPAQKSIDRIVIQGNRLHDPATGSNSWTQARPQSTNGHPFGPQAIDANDCGSNWVIRRNEISSGPGHYFNDGIGGAANFSERGFPFADADIAENRISHCRDDGIEAEGANRNVRIWGNYIDQTFTKVAIAPTQVGPIYVWRNIADRSAEGARESDRAQRGPFLKAGSRDSSFPGGGHIYVFNNTVLQRQPRRSQRLGLGPSYGLAESAGPVLNIVSRNNILLVPSPKNYSVLHQTPPAADGDSDFDYDLYNGLAYVKGVTRPEPHGIRAAPDFTAPGAAYRLPPDSPGIDKGQRIPNFTDGFRGVGPDIGAQEHGAPPMRFGLTAWRAGSAR